MLVSSGGFQWRLVMQIGDGSGCTFGTQESVGGGAYVGWYVVWYVRWPRDACWAAAPDSASSFGG